MKRTADREVWWDWRAARKGEEEDSGKWSPDEIKYALEKLVQRCVVLDNLSPSTSVHTIRTALEQFGKVRGVKLMRSSLSLAFTGMAIAEMESVEQRDQVVKELRDYLLMIGQMPRPARAIPATIYLMVDHPWRKFRRTVYARLVKPEDPAWKDLHEIAIKENLHIQLQKRLVEQRKEDELKLVKSQEVRCQESIDKLTLLNQEKSSQAFQILRKMYDIRQ